MPTAELKIPRTRHNMQGHWTFVKAAKPRAKEVPRNPEHIEFAHALCSISGDNALDYRGPINSATIHTIAGRLGFHIQVEKQNDGALRIWRRH